MKKNAYLFSLLLDQPLLIIQLSLLFIKLFDLVLDEFFLLVQSGISLLSFTLQCLHGHAPNIVQLVPVFQDVLVGL